MIPLTLGDTKLGVLEQFFGAEPNYIPIASGAGGIDAALNAILAALGQRLPSDPASTPQLAAEPLEDLVLELSELRIQQDAEGRRRATAKARLIHEPADPARPVVRSAAGLTSTANPSASSIAWRMVSHKGSPPRNWRESIHTACPHSASASRSARTRSSSALA